MRLILLLFGCWDSGGTILYLYYSRHYHFSPVLHKKLNFPLRISSVNVTKSAGNCETSMENFNFCAMLNDSLDNGTLWITSISVQISSRSWVRHRLAVLKIFGTFPQKYLIGKLQTYSLQVLKNCVLSWIFSW